MIPLAFTLQLPDWLTQLTSEPLPSFVTDQDKMLWLISLAQRNLADGGGPFAAAVFEVGTGKLIAPGVNRVIPSRCSVMHAEMMALILAQQQLGQYVLGQDDGRRFELVSTTEPCAMCLGAIPWSGICRLVCGARDEDARRIGFDEGDKPQDWVQCLARRGIDVVPDLCRTEAVVVLQRYVQQQGVLYNG